MSRIRTIKPDFWTNEKVLSCKALTRLLFIGMWNFADDYGRIAYSPIGIKAKVFPNDAVSIDDMRDMLNELCSNGLLVIYSANDKEYIEITGWDHQRIDKRQVSKIPGPFDDGSVVILGNSKNPPDSRRLPTTPAPVMEGKGGERKEDIRTVANATRPREDFFETFWKVYPRREGANPKEPARKLFSQAVKGGADPQDIINGARQCATAERKNIGTPYIPQAVKWLRDKRWEDYPLQSGTASANAKANGVLVKTGTEAWDAWQSHLKATTGKGSLVSLREDGWRFDSEYPPGYVPKPRVELESVPIPKMQAIQ